jgi:hypothetical protein
MPNHKTDINNNGPFSTDMIGMNYQYPDGDYATRAAIIQQHEAYTKGLLYFIGHDARMPEHLRRQMLQWGYPADEYTNNDHWTSQLYIREARRMLGAYTMTQANCQAREVVPDGIGMAAYTMDSHNSERIVVNGMVKNEGDVQLKGINPYPVAYRSITPKANECGNLLVPVCLSASHMAYGSIRMEPVFMVLAQSAAVAACQAIDGKTNVQQVNVQQLQASLKSNPLADNSQPEILVDNDDSLHTIINGDWKKETNGGYGPSFLVHALDNKSMAGVRFTPSIQKTGKYQVYIYCPKLPDAASGISVTIFDGVKAMNKTISKNDVKIIGQTSGEWVLLTTSQLPAGKKAWVQVSAEGADGAVVADAVLFVPVAGMAQPPASLSAPASGESFFLQSSAGHKGAYRWEMKKAGDINSSGEEISSIGYHPIGWQPAIVPGTVLSSLVANKVYTEPYYGDDNRRLKKLVPDIEAAGREFYHYWYRTSFTVPQRFTGKRSWLKFHGINYRCAIWLNGKKLGDMTGMFNDRSFDITSIIDHSGSNVLAAELLPVDVPGSYYKPGQGRTGAPGENHNGGDGEIGKNTTMLMSVGWDFTAPDGIRDRNTGIWREVELYTTGDVTLQHPFVQTKLPLPDTLSSKETISVEVLNATDRQQEGILTGSIAEAGLHFQKSVILKPHEQRTILFSPDEYRQLTISYPRLWWPVNKGKQNLYTLTLKFINRQNQLSHVLTTRFGIREISSDQQTPDQSRRFLVNGAPVFIRGTNWVPEAMLRNSVERTYAELRYTRQAGVNLLRLWGGGIAESDYFYQLCDEYGFLVWNEFWLTGDTRFPSVTALYLQNLAATIKRIRSHASTAYYVASNESDEVPGTAALVHRLDPSTGYQPQSECCGVHDGSPYKYENPMQYFENTASHRGSRVDGFNPEYGTPCLPVVESLKEMMPAKDCWPINDSVWNYLDGNGFHQLTTRYREAVDAFGPSASIEEYAKKAQFVGAMNYRSIWEVWNYNKFGYGDRFASGFLFWYHNSPLPQTASRMYDWFLEPTAALYYSQNALAPLHPQFDYLKNTVSVYNDYRRAFKGYTVEATVYDFNTKIVFVKKATVNIPADGVVNDALKIDFPDQLSQVHFIKLRLLNARDSVVADAFYWRSNDAYKGAWTMTGPAAGGFADINKLPAATITVNTVQQKDKDGLHLGATIANTSSRLAFFTRLKLLDENGKTIRPAYYSDNFFSLLPGESKRVAIYVPAYSSHRLRLVAEAWNTAPVIKTIK